MLRSLAGVPSELTHTEDAGVPASFSKTAAAEVVLTKGLQSLLWTSMERLIAFCKSLTDVKVAAAYSAARDGGEKALDGVESHV